MDTTQLLDLMGASLTLSVAWGVLSVTVMWAWNKLAEIPDWAWRFTVLVLFAFLFAAMFFGIWAAAWETMRCWPC